ncbi:MAG: DUF1579 domain-containing protein [Syntrophorhabdaceae bacterium]
MKKEKKPGTDLGAITERVERLAEPGSPHRLLASLSGNWDANLKSWTHPDRPANETFGSCEQKMILGGRFLHQTFSAELMGTPFLGIGVTGHDNNTGKYVSAWIDSMSTGITCFEGTISADGSTIIQQADYNDPVKGPMVWRSSLTIIDNDTMRFEMYGIDNEGRENKMIEINYARQG